MNDGHPSKSPTSRAGLLARLTGAATLAAGALLYGNGTSQLATLAPGTAGQVLVSAGAGAPVWTNIYGQSNIWTVHQVFSNGVYLNGASILPTQVTAAPFLVGGFASPTSGRLFIGDGTGWNFHLSKRISSTTTDLFTFSDTGNFGIGATPLYRFDALGESSLGYVGQPTNLAGCVRTSYSMSSSDSLGQVREVFRVANGRGANGADRLAFSMRRAATTGTWEYTNWIIGRVVDSSQQCSLQFGTDAAVDFMRLYSSALCFNNDGVVGNGLLQLPSGTTKANGALFGDVFFYRSGVTATTQLSEGSAIQHFWKVGANDIFVYVDSNASVLRSTGPLNLGANGADRLTIKTTGQTRFIPISADPAGAATGDVYYNSTTNKLRVYNGAWVDLH